MPEPELPDVALNRLCEAAYHLLKFQKVLTFTEMTNHLNKDKVKRNAGLSTDQHVAKADFEHIFECLFGKPGVVVKSGSGKSSVYQFRKEMLKMDVITNPNTAQTLLLADAIVRIVKAHTGETPISKKEAVRLATQEVGFTFPTAGNATARRPWGPLYRSVYSVKNGIVSSGGFLMVANRGVQKKLGTSKKHGKAQNRATQERKPSVQKREELGAFVAPKGSRLSVETAEATLKTTRVRIFIENN